MVMDGQATHCSHIKFKLPSDNFLESHSSCLYTFCVETFLERVWGRIWAEHFSKRKDEGSLMLLEELIDVILERAEFRFASRNFSDTLHNVLATVGIPRHEFYQFERELEAAQQTADEL
jgi:hypothetical protein